MPSDPKAKTRVRIAFLFLFVSLIVGSVGAYFVADLGKLQDRIAARESEAAREEYGKSHFANACLMARRLSEKGSAVWQQAVLAGRAEVLRRSLHSHNVAH